jgi:hypothetical protein
MAANLTIADIGRIDWFLRAGVMRQALRLHAPPVIGDAMAKFRRDLRLFQSFDIHSRLLGWDERWMFLEHRFVRAGRVIGVVAIRGLFHARARQSGEFLGALGAPALSPALPRWLLQWHQANEQLSTLLRSEEAR